MMMLISPAKKLNFNPAPAKDFTRVRFIKEIQEISKVVKKKSSADLMSLMGISKALGDLNVARYKAFDPSMPPELGKQALFAFNGDVYVGLHAEDFTAEDVKFAQKHLRILSGLYGLLKPLDNIQPYRLEMGCGLHVGKNNSLYEFWGDKITELIQSDMKEQKDKLLINLASEEYFQAVKTNKFKSGLIHIRFEEKRGGSYKVISFSAKKARGLMARYIIKNKISTLEELKSFDTEKYTYSASRSKEDLFTFVR
ncbi:MAG: peroxide stress protein YaaA [Saprospiraceae bacterium]